MNADTVSTLTVAELRRELTDRGLSTSGLKTVLATRLQEAISEAAAAAADPPLSLSALPHGPLDHNRPVPRICASQDVSRLTSTCGHAAICERKVPQAAQSFRS